ncbi:MAG: cytochrome c oxidase accessory protein CcoG [Myxococcota bacterium]|nr:cytochrome c oxidase accessory protein CcoG [Myxococcota bacterium]
MIQARPVQGAWRRLRWAADAVLIAILLGIPWVRIGGEPLVWLDVPGRKFHVFGLVIFPQELYFLWLILAGLALALFFFTALAGRLWCGWACPQTVFTDVFAAVARFVQGWKGTRPPRRLAPWRRAATHVIWLGLSAVVAFHLVGYFVPPPELLARLRAGELAGAAGGFLVVMTALTYLDFGLVRQTFCKYLCPYARFQGVLFDRDTLVVGYDVQRGEPRGKKGVTRGDCVDCGLCVQVCPTGIDIRDGLQLECIACTQCIDACNGVMAKTGRPPDLIGYRSLAGLEGARRARLLRPRVALYGALMVAVGVAFVGLLSARNPMDLTVAHNREALFGRAADGRLGNAFTLRLENRERVDRAFRLRVEGTGREGDGDDAFDLVAGMNPIQVAAISTVEARVFVMAPSDYEAEGGRAPLRFVAERVDDPTRHVVRRTQFLVPGAGGG